MKIKHNLLKASIFVTLLLLMMELYRWYLWDIDFEHWTVWTFLTDKRNTGLLWNLLLAWIAVFWAWLVYQSSNRILYKFLSLVWILWLPNTLYMVTDIKYFGRDEGMTLLYDIIFYALFAIAGIVLYLLAVHLVWLKYKFTKKWLGLITVLAIIGVVVGRIFRWNSWDIFTDPQKMLSDFINLF